jgi:hypothetical protein
MKAFECIRCGSKELFEEGRHLVCAYCQSRFLPESDKSSRMETLINIKSDIQVLLEKCAEDPANRVRYANLILDIDPGNDEANRILRRR